MEGITHSLCSLEFEDHRPLYDWVIEHIDLPSKPRQIEFARLGINNTVMSKRKLRYLVENNIVSGWDDPRMPTLCGLRRRGYTPAAIRNFCERVGVAKVNSTIEYSFLEHLSLIHIWLGCNCGKLHLMASYALLRYPEIGGNYTRVGIALYGVLSAKGDADRFGAEQLRPVLSLKARVALVRHLAPGEGAGYGLQFRADRNTKLATLSIGYADGLPRKLGSGIGTVLLHGFRASIVGRICMDQTLVDVTDIPSVSPGDAAILIGRSGEQKLTACDLAEQTGTISNEILKMGIRDRNFCICLGMWDYLDLIGYECLDPALNLWNSRTSTTTATIERMHSAASCA